MRSGTGAQRGFSLIELMVSISVLAILLSIAVPSFRDASLSSQLRSSSNDLVASTHFARSEALKRNTVVTLCVSSDGTTCGAGGWEQGWIVVAGATLLNYHAATPSGLKITDSGGATTLAFQPTGIGALGTSVLSLAFLWSLFFGPPEATSQRSSALWYNVATMSATCPAVLPSVARGPGRPGMRRRTR